MEQFGSTAWAPETFELQLRERSNGNASHIWRSAFYTETDCPTDVTADQWSCHAETPSTESFLGMTPILRKPSENMNVLRYRKVCLVKWTDASWLYSRMIDSCAERDSLEDGEITRIWLICWSGDGYHVFHSPLSVLWRWPMRKLTRTAPASCNIL